MAEQYEGEPQYEGYDYGLNDAVKDLEDKKRAQYEKFGYADTERKMQNISDGLGPVNAQASRRERSKQQQMKEIKTRVKQKHQQNPFQKYRIYKPIAEDRARTNPAVMKNLRKFEEHQKHKKDYKNMTMGQNTPRSAAKMEKQYDKEDKKQRRRSYLLALSIMAEDLRRATSGPVGWFQNLKGCFKMTVICLTVIGGGALATILCLV